MPHHLLATAFFNDDVAGSAWLRAALSSEDVGRLELAFRATHDHVQAGPWKPSAEAARVLDENHLGWTARNALAAEVASVLCVLRSAALSPDPTSLVRCWFETSDSFERRAILRALPLLPHARSYLKLARRAVTSGPTTDFDAICFDNPYPATYFPDDMFDAMVETALNRNHEVGKIIGLVERGRWSRSQLRCTSERSLDTPSFDRQSFDQCSLDQGESGAA